MFRSSAMHVMRAARVSNVVMDFLSKRTSLPQRSSYAWNSKQPSYPHSTALFARYLSSTSRKMVKDAQTVIEYVLFLFYLAWL